MTENIYPNYYELYKSAAILARKVIIKAYGETRNITASLDSGRTP